VNIIFFLLEKTLSALSARKIHLNWRTLFRQKIGSKIDGDFFGSD